MTKIRVLHIPTGLYREISFNKCINYCCADYACPKDLPTKKEKCETCPWEMGHIVNELEYDIEIIND